MSELTAYPCFSPAEKRLIQRAIKTVEKQFIVAEDAPAFVSPDLVTDYLRLHLAEQDREHFLVLFLNSQHRLICAEKIFNGDLRCIHISPEIIARKCLLYNAGAVILSHNHPSGCAVPSEADRHVTRSIVKCLSLFSIPVLDHIITGSGDNYWSFAGHGEL